jgi:hypothetical protein
LDDGLQVRGLDIGFAVGAPAPAEMVHHEADVLIVAARHDRRCPIRATHHDYSNEPSGEQLGAARGEFHVGPRFVPHHPTFVDRPLDTVAELLRRAACLWEGGVD